MSETTIEPSTDFELGAVLRGEMATEMGNDWDAENPDWAARYAEYFRSRAERGDAQLFVARVDGAALYTTLGFGTGREMEKSLYDAQ